MLGREEEEEDLELALSQSAVEAHAAPVTLEHEPADRSWAFASTPRLLTPDLPAPEPAATTSLAEATPDAEPWAKPDHPPLVAASEATAARPFEIETSQLVDDQSDSDETNPTTRTAISSKPCHPPKRSAVATRKTARISVSAACRRDSCAITKSRRSFGAGRSCSFRWSRRNAARRARRSPLIFRSRDASAF